MIALWLLYSLLFGVLVSAVAAVVERLLRLWHLPVRAVWAAALAVTLITPIGVWLWPAAVPVVDAPVATLAAIPVVATPTMAATAPPLIDRLVQRAESFATATAARFAPLDGPLLALWAAASGALLLSLVRSTRALRRRRRQWKQRVVDGVEVLVAPDAGPAVVGGGAPSVVLPAWALELDPPLRRLVLHHETEHVAAGDPQLLLAGVAALVAAPWNGVLWWQVGRLRLAVELDCDRRVLRQHRDVERYGLLLLAVGQRAGGLLRLATPALSEPTTSLERRIAAMTEHPPRRRILQASLLAAAAAAVAIAACVAPSPNRIAGPDPEPPVAQTIGRGVQAVAAPDTAPRAAEGAYFAFQVEDAVTPLNNASPTYPASLRAQGVSGRVIAQFVVDTAGRVTPGSFRVIESSDDLFTQAVRNALARMQFTPATVGGRKVRQLVQQPFMFGLAEPPLMQGDTLLRVRTLAPLRVPGAAPARVDDAAPRPSVMQPLRPLRRPAPTAEGDPTYFAFQVEKAVVPLTNVAPTYPAALRAEGVSGEVIVQFVVNTDGQVEMSTFKAIESSDDLFTQAVRNALPRMQFTPAEIGGRRVRQLVQQPFQFNVGR